MQHKIWHKDLNTVEIQTPCGSRHQENSDIMIKVNENKEGHYIDT